MMKTTTFNKIIDLINEEHRLVNVGDQDPLDSYTKLKIMSDQCKMVMDAIQEQAVAERDAYGKEDVRRHGFRITKSEGTKRYDYKHISAWQSLKKQLTDIEHLAKVRADRQLSEGWISCDSNGEEVDAAIITYGKPHLRFIFDAD